MLDQGPVPEELLEVVGVVRRAEARPQREVGVLGDHAGEVDLQESQVAHDLEGVGRTGRVEQLRADGHAPGLPSRQLVDAPLSHDADPRRPDRAERPPHDDPNGPPLALIG